MRIRILWGRLVQVSPPYPHTPLNPQIRYPTPPLVFSSELAETELLATGATGHRYETRSHGPLSSTGPGIGAGRTNNMGTTTSSTGVTGNGAYTGAGTTGMGSTNTIGGGRAAVAPGGTGVQGSIIPSSPVSHLLLLFTLVPSLFRNLRHLPPSIVL